MSKRSLSSPTGLDAALGEERHQERADVAVMAGDQYDACRGVLSRILPSGILSSRAKIPVRMRRLRRSLLALSAAPAIALAGAGCNARGAAPAPEPPATASPLPAQTGFEPAPTRGYILISIDALRADHLGVYGYDRDTSPFLDELARARDGLRSRLRADPVDAAVAHVDVHRALSGRARRLPAFGRPRARDPHPARDPPARRLPHRRAHRGGLRPGRLRLLARLPRVDRHSLRRRHRRRTHLRTRRGFSQLREARRALLPLPAHLHRARPLLAARELSQAVLAGAAAARRRRALRPALRGGQQRPRRDDARGGRVLRSALRRLDPPSRRSAAAASSATSKRAGSPTTRR